MATPPVFIAGQVLTAAQMNKVGLWLVKSQTIGTAVSSVVVSDVFSADFDNYRIVIKGGTVSADNNLLMTLGSTATGYYWAGTGYSYAGASLVGNGSNATSWFAGYGRSSGLSSVLDLCNPFLTDETYFAVAPVQMSTTGGYIPVGGYVNNTTSYTAFTITTSTGTITGGTIDVYGYRRA
jgi:hypothetical protein